MLQRPCRTRHCFPFPTQTHALQGRSLALFLSSQSEQIFGVSRPAAQTPRELLGCLFAAVGEVAQNVSSTVPLASPPRAASVALADAVLDLPDAGADAAGAPAAAACDALPLVPGGTAICGTLYCRSGGGFAAAALAVGLGVRLANVKRLDALASWMRCEM